MLDQQFRLVTLAAAGVLVLVMTYLRFCGSVVLPGKPPPPAAPRGSQSQLLASATATPSMYKGFLESDASAAGVPAPSVADMSRKFAYRVDDARHVLELGQPPIEVAGLRLRIERAGGDVVMVIESQLEADAAYSVMSVPSGEIGTCSAAGRSPFNANVIGKGLTERRVECRYRDGMVVAVTKVETMEVPPLSAWYLSQLPPALLGLDNRIGRNHRGVQSRETCSQILSQVVRMGIEQGEIGWRDLADFYARHRCQTYRFIPSYRAFKSDNERALPAAGS